MKARVFVIVLSLVALALGAVVVAQDGTTDSIWEGFTGEVLTFHDPDPAEVEGMVVTDGNLEAVTSDSENWYGQIVTLEGTVQDFVNARIFAVGEDALLDSDQVLVVNNSTIALPPEVMEGARIRVTGRIHPSLVAVEEGAQTDFGALFTEANGQVGQVDQAGMDGTTTDDVSTRFTQFYNTWNNIGMTATDNTVADLQTFDQNLETLTDEQRTQLADALDQDAAQFDADQPALAQNLRDTSTALRNNDIAGTRTGLQNTVTELQNQQNMQAQQQTQQQPTAVPGTQADVASPDFSGFNSALGNIGITASDDNIANLQELDRNLETMSEEQRMQIADAMEQNATSLESSHPTVAQSFRDTANALRGNDVATARSSLQFTTAELQNQQMMQDQQIQQQPSQTSDMMAQTARPDMVEWVQSGLVPDTFHNFTILEIFSVENVDFVEFTNNIGAGN